MDTAPELKLQPLPQSTNCIYIYLPLPGSIIVLYTLCPHPRLLGQKCLIWRKEIEQGSKNKCLIHTSTQHAQYLAWYTGPAQATYTGHFVYGLNLASYRNHYHFFSDRHISKHMFVLSVSVSVCVYICVNYINISPVSSLLDYLWFYMHVVWSYAHFLCRSRPTFTCRLWYVTTNVRLNLIICHDIGVFLSCADGSRWQLSVSFYMSQCIVRVCFIFLRVGQLETQG